MRVVSNTSPLSNLAMIGHLGLVREQLGTLLVPPAVRAELLRNPHAEARLAVEAAMEEGWILVRRLASAVPPHIRRASRPRRGGGLAQAPHLQRRP